jgi:hypothetical protein
VGVAPRSLATVLHKSLTKLPKGARGVHSTMPLVVLIVVIAAIALVAIGLWVVNSVD